MNGDLTRWLVIGALGAIAVVLTRIQAARRSKEFKEEADRLGLRYTPGSGALETEPMKHPLFSLGDEDEREFSHVFEGAYDGVQVRVFEYEYTTGGGKHETTYRQTVAMYQVSRPLPAFEMFPERFYHSFAELAGYKDIDFDWNPAFSAEYRLLGRDEEAVRALFNSSISSALALNPGWTVEGADRTLLVYRSDVRISPRELEKFLAQTRAVHLAFAST